MTKLKHPTENEIQAYLKSDRQWTRSCRIARAQAMLEAYPEDALFWNTILNRLGE